MLVVCHEPAECGLNSTVAQMNTSFNRIGAQCAVCVVGTEPRP